MRLGRAARKQLGVLIAGANSLKGDFFRSVAFRYFHPDDVISGDGTRLHGGRFVPVGVRAVYASLEEETALREVASRKSVLGGRSQISVGEYPRMTYVLSVPTNRNLDLPRRFHRSWQTSFVSVCVGRGIRPRRNWLPSGFRRGSTVLFFRPSRALAATLQCIRQTPPLIVSSFAIVPRSWRPSADHAPGSATGSGSFLTRGSRCQAFSSARFWTDLL